MERPAEWYEGRPAANVRFHEGLDGLQARLVSLADVPAQVSFGFTTATSDEFRVTVGGSGVPHEIATSAPGVGPLLKWAVMKAVHEMHSRRSAITSLLTGVQQFGLGAFNPGGGAVGVREAPENREDAAEFDRLIQAAHEGSQAARAELEEHMATGTAAFAAHAPQGTVAATVDSTLLVTRLQARFLPTGADQRLGWLLRAAGIAHLGWERRSGASWAQDVPQFSDQLPGQPSFFDLLGAGEAGWPPEDPVERADREEFLADAVIRTPDQKAA
ncbi:MAG: hypothetical protein ACRC20_09595 [Segniliparus sp.]|uniref:hypothetical protein n=1 Tax=Segniliparus sp. TaxID=2804064 RepID=UPI003F3CED02